MKKILTVLFFILAIALLTLYWVEHDYVSGSGVEVDETNDDDRGSDEYRDIEKE
jgi:uncharacterized protein YxeA